MISKKLVLILSLCAAGSLVPAYGAPCVNTTLDVVLATNGGVCNIGAYTFSFGSFAIIGDTGVVTPPAGLTAAEVNFSIVTNLNGTGFLLTPNVPFTAGPGSGNIDSELRYIVSTPTPSNLNSIYLNVTGSTSGTAFDHVLEQYCLGGTTLPPAGNGFCPGNQPTLAQNQLDASLNGGFAATATGSFASQTSIAILKDIDVNGGSSGSAALTGVYQQFGPAVVPEPATYLLSFIGLGLLFLGKRNLSRS